MNKRSKILLLGLFLCCSTHQLFGNWFERFISCGALVIALCEWRRGRVLQRQVNELQSSMYPQSKAMPNVFNEHIKGMIYQACDSRYVLKTEWQDVRQQYDQELKQLHQLIEGPLVFDSTGFDMKKSGLRALFSDLYQGYGRLYNSVNSSTYSTPFPLANNASK